MSEDIHSLWLYQKLFVTDLPGCHTDKDTNDVLFFRCIRDCWLTSSIGTSHTYFLFLSSLRSRTMLSAEPVWYMAFCQWDKVILAPIRKYRR